MFLTNASGKSNKQYKRKKSEIRSIKSKNRAQFHKGSEIKSQERE